MDLQPKPIALLPQDREIMEITGLSESQYRSFILECYRQGKLRPGEPTNFLVIPFLIKLAIGVALTYLSTLLAPKPAEPGQPTARKESGGQNYVTGQRFAPTSGFDTVQNVVELGTVVPLVYANRRQLDGYWYGGVRVNTNLLWAQLYSVGGGQLLRAIFLVGEGVVPEPNAEQYAIGNNLIRNYDLAANDVSRLSLYYADGSREDNRIVSNDFIAGRIPALDLGNAQSAGADDVFQARTADGWDPDFSYVTTPSNQSSFGVGPFIGNNFPYRKNPRIQPRVTFREEFDGDGNSVIDEDGRNDLQKLVDRRKDNWIFYGRAGVTGGNGSLVNFAVGDTFTYEIFRDSDWAGGFVTERGDTGEIRNDTKDIANAVASRQNSYDDAIQVGDRYLCGTAIAVCVNRSPEAFNSETNNFPVGGGNNITATFEVVRAGSLHTYNAASLHPGLDNDGVPALAPNNNATLRSHLMKLAEGFVAVERESRYIEVGLRSVVNMRLQGICAFQNVDRDYDQIDEDQAQDNAFYTNPTYTGSKTRYSFFRVAYRVSGTADYTTIPCMFAVRSISSSAVYNYLRFEFSTAATYELRFTPISGYEARSSSVQINVLDFKNANRERFVGGGVTCIYSGVSNFLRNTDNFAVEMLRSSVDITPRDDGAYHADAYASMAEDFIFDEISSSATGPEHDIVYVNTQTENSIVPNYSFLALVGMNIRSTQEIRSLQQFSVYCNQGINSTNSFPEVLRDLLTNTRYGAGNILNEGQVDIESFEAAAEWCLERRYFFDGVIDSKINIRSWGARTAGYFLLDLIVRNGRFALQPVVNFDDPDIVTGLFTAGNILEDSFELSYADEDSRIPPRVSVKWREEKANNDQGLFPVVRQLTVREATTAEDAPLEDIDLSDFCTSERQAIDVAKYICRTRRLLNHSVRFQTTPTQAALDIGAVFKLGMETVTYEQPQNGAISDLGVVTAWPPLVDGTYDVLLWDGTGTGLQEVSLVISGGTTTYRSAVFCLRNHTSNTQTYKTQALSYTEEGNIDVEATVYPTNAAGVSLIVDGWDVAANWVIEGQLY